MAHTPCINGHHMWNGDGAPCVFAFRDNYFRDYQNMHPNIKLGDKFYTLLDDFCDDDPNEGLDCWFCLDCRSLAIFTKGRQENEELRRDYVFSRDTKIPIDKILTWEVYTAFRSKTYYEVLEKWKGYRPFDIFANVSSSYKYRVSPDKKTICKLHKNEGKICFVYTQVREEYVKNY